MTDAAEPKQHPCHVFDGSTLGARPKERPGSTDSSCTISFCGGQVEGVGQAMQGSPKLLQTSLDQWPMAFEMEGCTFGHINPPPHVALGQAGATLPGHEEACPCWVALAPAN